MSEKRPIDAAYDAAELAQEAGGLAEHIREAEPGPARERLFDTLVALIDDAAEEAVDAAMMLDQAAAVGDGEPEENDASGGERSVGVRYIQWLAEQEFDSSHTLRRKPAAELSQDATAMEILERLADSGSVGPLTLANELNSPVADIEDTLANLFAADVVARDKTGDARLKHDYVFVEPLVFGGEVLR